MSGSGAHGEPSEHGERFAPWSLPAALLFAAGIVMAALDLSWAWLGLALLAVPVLLRLGGGRWMLLLVLLVPAGYLRYATWEAQPNPLDDLMGGTVTVSGLSDGRYLELNEPAGARVVLSPRGEVGAGRVALSGELVAPPGKRNPGGFDYRAYLKRRGVHGQLFVEEVLSFMPEAPGVKARLHRGVTAGLGERTAALMQAMTLGIRDDLDDLRDIFAASGLAHLLALSGLHVGVLVGALGLCLGVLGTGRYALLIPLVIGFVALVGVTPSVLRAGAMTTAVLLSLWLGGGRLEPWPALALAVLFTLAWNPSWLFDLSFQLSYLAVAGILLFTGPLSERLLGEEHHKLAWWRPKKFVVGGIIVSVSAQALSLPLVASSFGSVPLLSPLVNVLALPLATLLVPLGFLAGLLGLVSLSLATLLNGLTGALAGLLIFLADWGARFPGLRWGEIGPFGYAYYAIAMTALVLALHGRLRPYRALLVVTAALLASTVSLTPHRTPEVVVLDVGQGDSVLIRLPGRTEILVDAGGSPFGDYDVGAETVLPALVALGVDELELVIASHTDADHMEGLLSVLKEMPVQQLAIGTPSPEAPLFERLLSVAAERGVPVMQVRRGQALELGGARLAILNPPREPYEADNDNSVAFVLRWGGAARALFLGDASMRVERDLAFPDVDLLMVGHHGSRTSTSRVLLAAAQPDTAVISYGRNGYGHPHPAVLARLEAQGVEVHETHEHGAVRLPLVPEDQPGAVSH